PMLQGSSRVVSLSATASPLTVPAGSGVSSRSLHDALPILRRTLGTDGGDVISAGGITIDKAAHIVKIDGAPVDLSFKEFELLARSEEHTSELQSRFDLVCRLLLDKKNLC